VQNPLEIHIPDLDSDSHPAADKLQQGTTPMTRAGQDYCESCRSFSCCHVNDTGTWDGRPTGSNDDDDDERIYFNVA